MRVRAMRNFTLAGKDYKAGQPFDIDDGLGNKLMRTRYVASLETDAVGVEQTAPLAPIENAMGMLRRETRTTAPIPNPPAGPEAMHPALLPHGAEELTEEHLDRALGGPLAEEVAVLELVADTDPDSSNVPAEQRNAAAEEIARKEKADATAADARPPAEAKADAVAEEPPAETRDPRAELEERQRQEAARQRQASADRKPAPKR